MNRFLFVAPQQDKEEVIECAFKLIEHDYNQSHPSTKMNEDHLVIDNEKKSFWFTDEIGMNHILQVIPIMEECEVTETNLIAISKWQSKQKIKA